MKKLKYISYSEKLFDSNNENLAEDISHLAPEQINIDSSITDPMERIKHYWRGAVGCPCKREGK